MTHDPDPPERDPALDAAWREHSSEMPPPRLDAAILAAAHRAAGSGPQPVAAQETGARPAEAHARTRAATGPQRWWMPLAAAATIGAVALGILQTMPQHESVIAPPVSDMPARAGERAATLPDAPRDMLPPKEKRDAPGALAEADATRTPAAAAPPPAPPAAGARKQSARTAPPATDSIAPSAAPFAAAPQPSPAVPAAVPQPSPAAPAAVPQPSPAAPAATTQPSPDSLATAPQPFPAEKKAESGESVDIKSRARAAAAAKPAAAPPARQYSELARTDMRQRTEPTQAAPATAGAMALGKSAANSAAPSSVVDVDAWIVRIRKLHDEGKLADAANELLALRRAIPDVDGRLPPELRAWAATVKP